MLAPARTYGLLVFLVLLPWSGSSGQESCAPNSTNGLRPFGPVREVRFEPSAVVALPDECAVLVFSDKSEVLEGFLFSFRGSDLSDGEVVQPTNAPSVVQLEAATRTADGEGVLVVTSGTFNGASAVDQSREDRALILGREEDGSWRVSDDLSSPWRRYVERLRRDVGGWVKIEGLHAMGDRYLVGIRQFGDAYTQFDFGVRISVWDPSEPTVTNILADPRSVTFEETGDLSGSGRAYHRSYGVSSLECSEESAPGRLRCFMLASSEGGPGINDVKSRLMVFDLEELKDVTSLPGREVACFWNKAEGLTLLGQGRALVVFDSDQQRKGGASAGSDLFALEDNQDHYWVGDVEPVVVGEFDDAPRVTCVGP